MDGMLAVVEDGNNGGKFVKVGKVTPSQRPVTLELMQHESVAFGELAAQYLQSPCKFVENPQFCASFSLPVMHRGLSESAGSAQLVKSALIWSKKSSRGLPQSLLLTDISSSLVACCA